MHTTTRFALLLAVCTACLPQPAVAKALQTFHLMTLSAHNPKEALRLPSTVALDPTLPVWVSYTLFAVSSLDKPAGAVVLGVESPGLAADAAGAKVGFSTDTMTRLPHDLDLTTRLTQQLGQHTPSHMAKILGPDLHAAYQALRSGQGAAFGKTIVKTYPAPNTAPGAQMPPMWLSLEQNTRLQPALVIATVGQGEVPPQQQNYFGTFSGDAERTEWQLAGGLSFLIAGIYGFGRNRIRKNEEAQALLDAAEAASARAPNRPAAALAPLAAPATLPSPAPTRALNKAQAEPALMA
jgi:hypothetical protein